MMDEDVEFVPLQPEDGGGNSLETYRDIVDTIGKTLESLGSGNTQLPVQANEEETIIEFIPEVPHIKEADGELKPVMDDSEALLRKKAEDKVNDILLSDRERMYLYAIRSMQFENRFSPTCHELARMFGLSPARSKVIVSQLVKKGFIEWSKHRNWVHKRILFPRGMTFPWRDSAQFPLDTFIPEYVERKKHK